MLLLSTKCFPRLGRSVGGVLASQQAELVHLLLIVSDARVEFCHSSDRCIAGNDFRIGGARSTCRCQKRFTFRSNTADDIVALAAGNFAHRLVERLAKMVGGIAYRFGDVLRAALFNPQQAGDAPMLGTAGTFASETEPEQVGQVLFGILAV